MITFILLNGPAQSGKTTLALAIQSLLETKYADRVMRFELKAPLISALNGLVENHFPNYENHTYEELKKASFGQNITGRDIMIEMGNTLRLRDPWFLPRILGENVEQADKADPIVIVDDLGFEPEFQYFLHHPDSRHMVIYTESRHHRLYSHGQQFENDSRVCLRGHADFIDPEPDVVVESISAIVGQLGE